MHPGPLMFATSVEPLSSIVELILSRREVNEVGSVINGTAGSGYVCGIPFMDYLEVKDEDGSRFTV